MMGHMMIDQSQKRSDMSISKRRRMSNRGSHNHSPCQRRNGKRQLIITARMRLEGIALAQFGKSRQRRPRKSVTLKMPMALF
jgi:hypothetical protein